MRIYGRCEDGEDVEKPADGDGNSGTDTNCRIDIQYRVTKSHEEEEQRYVQETRNSLCHNGHVPAFRSVMQVLPKPGTLQRVAVPLEDMHVIANPLLDEGGKECCGETENKGHKPENVYADVGCQGLESRERGRWSGRDGNLWSDGGYLVGNLIKDSDVLLEVIDHLVCRADFQVLFAVDYERGEDGGK